MVRRIMLNTYIMCRFLLELRELQIPPPTKQSNSPFSLENARAESWSWSGKTETSSKIDGGFF
jgi:hypothetical protein